MLDKSSKRAAAAADHNQIRSLTIDGVHLMPDNIVNLLEKALQDIIDRPADLDRVSQFEKFGLKPPKHFRATSQPALDTARIESFRERLEIMQKQRWEVRRGMSVTISHWSVVDLKKFNAFLDLIKQKISPPPPPPTFDPATMGAPPTARDVEDNGELEARAVKGGRGGGFGGALKKVGSGLEAWHHARHQHQRIPKSREQC